MEDCYRILGVQQNATAAEIKRAYRKKAKELHPDLSPNGDTALQFQELVKAYEVLSDARQRSIFDVSYAASATYRKHRSSHSFDYRTWLLKRDDEESKCKLVFFDLMHNREDDAVELFKELNSSSFDFTLAKWFTREDFMDYGFILSEELVLRQEYYDAFILLEQIIKMQYSYDYFRLFFPEVLQFTKNILRKHIAGVINDELAMDAFERALELNLGSTEDAFYLVKIGEAYLRMDDVESARVCISEALKIDPNVVLSTGIKKRIMGVL